MEDHFLMINYFYTATKFKKTNLFKMTIRHYKIKETTIIIS